MKRFIIAALAMFVLAALAPQAEAGGLLARILAPRAVVAVPVRNTGVFVQAPFVSVGVGGNRGFGGLSNAQLRALQRQAELQRLAELQALQRLNYSRNFGFAPVYSGGFQSSFSYGQSFGAAGGCGAFLGY